jgi:succinoglycan biosynthesis transport protein ExoP
MNFIQLLRVVNRNLNILFLCSIGLAVAVFFFTRNLPKTYMSITEIYTGISSGMAIEDVEGGKKDYRAANNEYSNLFNIINNKQTAIEVGERLLAHHLLMDEPDEYHIGRVAWEASMARITPELWDSLVIKDSYEATLENIKKFRIDQFGTFRVQQIFESGSSPYSHQAISSSKVRRVGNSDLIEISYAWSDPGICQQTLEILNDVFSQRLLRMKVERSEDVVEYFRDKVTEARKELEKAEDSLALFRIRNKIIDYSEQTRSITSSKKGIEDEYQAELQVKAAAEAKLKKLESQLAITSKRGENYDELLQKRNELAELKSRILELEVYYNDPDKVNKLKSKASSLEAEISSLASKVYNQNNSQTGVSSENLLSEWLQATLALDESNARLRVLSSNMKYYENVYNTISPLGSQLAKLERAVEVAESKYLELNKSFNWAIMRQQSETIATSGITVTTAPIYPLQPVESKQLLLVLLAAVIGFVIPLTMVLLILFLDNTVRNPIRGEELTGLKIIGAYPDINLSNEYKSVDLDWLNSKSIGLISQNLRLEMRRVEKAGKGPKSILIFSTRENDGKSFITKLIAEELASFNKKVLIISPDFDSDIDGISVHSYEAEHSFVEITSLHELIPEGTVYEQYDYILLELKGILSNQYPIELVEQFDLAINVLSAKRIWNKADNFALTEFVETLGFQPRLIVNGVSPDYMDQVLGEIEKKRSALRKFLKGLITMQFRSRKFSSGGGKKSKLTGKSKEAETKAEETVLEEVHTDK